MLVRPRIGAGRGVGRGDAVPPGAMITRNIEGTSPTGAPGTGRTEPVEARQVSGLYEPRQQQERKPGRIHTEEVTGSIPVSRTRTTPVSRGFFVPECGPGNIWATSIGEPGQ